VNGARRHKHQRPRLNREMIKIDIKGRGSTPHPEDLIKVVPMRPMSILSVSEGFFKRANVKLFAGSDVVIGK
jgi:hypothetical protein